MIEDPGSACGLRNFSNGNVVGQDQMLDPGGLADNGGSTQTIALLPGSPAIDGGDPTACAAPPVNGVDQRGFLRPTELRPYSIGAYEWRSIGPPPSCVGDCLRNGVVGIDEVITVVGLALGSDAPFCTAGDPDGNRQITIEEIVATVENSLQGCPTATPEEICLASGGAVSSGLCCTGVGDFPDTCVIGLCGCAPEFIGMVGYRIGPFHGSGTRREARVVRENGAPECIRCFLVASLLVSRRSPFHNT